ncbi:peptidoglycan DD-metalloendopeptidase family protein [Azoarcus sp. DN11]|uniref:peptidoglycan DD-metalloendopeptidase family protein n=1 Tax=Azoarcus sp. DN11 TaxID=356837 RepID=UPI000EAFBC8B|nr:peptidoglycan DD-metalloendopeptidase family protein [Azoarcus sp. DN11]AYH46184.1 hypothetical protein CDA09_22865 [Azoarcus sp. DN11]
MNIRYYKVKNGDSLWKISRKEGIDFTNLLQVNRITKHNGHFLRAGQKIILPEQSDYDTCLSIEILDIRFAPIKHARVRLTYDEKRVTRIAGANGKIHGIVIKDHARGLEVDFRTIDRRWITVAKYKTLPLGDKRLILTNREFKDNGQYQTKRGTEQLHNMLLRHDARSTNPNQHIEPGTVHSKNFSKSVQKPLPLALKRQIRTESGIHTHAVAPIYIEENLHLSPANEKYRKLIIATAHKFELSPPTLAALIDAEAVGGDEGWRADSHNGTSDAAGLTQFLESTWLNSIAQDPRTILNQRIAGKNLRNTDIFQMRYDPELSIDASAAYATQNLNGLRAGGYAIDALNPEDLAKVIYAAHHEGLRGLMNILSGSFTQERAEFLLPKQVGGEKARQLAHRFDNDFRHAYLHWLFRDYIDAHINVRRFMVDPGVARTPRSMEEIFRTLGRNNPLPPAGKRVIQSVSPSMTPADSASEGWRDPLDECVIRSAGLAKGWEGAIFRPDARTGKNGEMRPHQGVDLVATPGTTIYAVADGRIVLAEEDDIGAYGRRVTLGVDVNDLPVQQRNLCNAHQATDEVFFFYAHLDSVCVVLGQPVRRGTRLGATGSSGNAKGMTTIARGAHLHFEVRRKSRVGPGLEGRLDPLPFLNTYRHP